MSNSVSFLRRVSMAEGISYLVLLGIAMPLKYWAGMPMAVRVVGSLHGLLFVVFCAALLWVLVAARWPFFRVVGIFVASFIPFLPLWLDRKFKDWGAE
jgi:integral membrane protein